MAAVSPLIPPPAPAASAPPAPAASADGLVTRSQTATECERRVKDDGEIRIRCDED